MMTDDTKSSSKTSSYDGLMDQLDDGSSDKAEIDSEDSHSELSETAQPESTIDPDDIEARFEALEEKAATNWDKALRAMSELENFRKRAERDISNAHKYGQEKFIKELLPIVDNLERALSSFEEESEAMASLREGIELTLKMFLEALGRFSVTVIDPVGEVFDPNQHEAMTMAVEKSVKPGTVLQVYQKGYCLHERVIRPAKVVVAKD